MKARSSYGKFQWWIYKEWMWRDRTNPYWRNNKIHKESCRNYDVGCDCPEPPMEIKLAWFESLLR